MIPLASMIEDPTTTPAGIITSARSMEHLVKAEVERQKKEENKAKFFSNFSLAQNMIAYGAREKPQGTPHFALLYEAAKKSFIDAIIIQARCDQVKRVWQKAINGKSKAVGFRVVHERNDDKDFKGSKQIDEQCREMEKFLVNPTPAEYIWLYPHNIRPHTGLKDLIVRLTRSELIIDRKCILRYKRRDGKGYSAFHWMPGDTIKPVDEAIRTWAQKNEKDRKVAKYTADKMSYATGFDISKSSFVQFVDGQITSAYTDEELCVHISNPSDELNRWGYGTSRLEMSLDVTTTLIYAWTYNREMFKTNYPEAILAVSGDYDKEGLAAFKQQVLSEAGGVGNNWRLPVIPAGDKENFKVESIKLRESPKDMLFDQFIRMMVMFKLSAYGAHAQTLNLTTDSGGSANSLFGANPSSEIEFSQEHGLIPAIEDMCEWLTEAIIKPTYPELKLIVEGLNPEDEKQAVDIRTSRVNKWITRNEARMEEGLDPIGDTEDETNMWNLPADAPLMSQMTQLNMMEQQQGGGDDQEGEQQAEQDDDEQQDDSDQYYKSLRKSQPVKFLRISLDDQL